jgi:hypothetical protein
MKVAYLYYMIAENQLGVEIKVRQQAKAVADAGITNLEIIVLNPWKEQHGEIIRYLKLKQLPAPLSHFELLFGRYRLISRSVDLDRYDTIILRYPLADMTGKQFVARHRVITEHHTNELAELRARLGSGTPLSHKIARLFLLLLERRYGGPLLRRCGGHIAVTDEIRDLQLARSGGKPRAVTIGNGIYTKDVPLTGFEPFDGRELHAIFLASSLRPWHGLERIVDSFNSYEGGVKLFLHVVGEIAAEELKAPGRDLENVTFHGTLIGRPLNRLMGKMNLALSSLAPYKKNMYQGSTLKIREYIARGIPFVLAYADSDLRWASEHPRFFLKCENDASPLDIERIIVFAQEVSQKPAEISRAMRAYATEHLDWAAKLGGYLRFARMIAEERDERLSPEIRA